MPREVFPYVEAQVVIQGFLAGETRRLGASLEGTHARSGKLHVLNEVFMWYDTQGALWAQIAGNHGMHSHIRAFNYAAGLLGIPYLVLQRNAVGETQDIIQTRLFFDDQDVGCSPFLVLGSMSMRAWREGVKSS